MASNSVSTDNENITSVLLVDINRLIELEWELCVTNEAKVSNFTLESLENKFLAETKTDETKAVDSMVPQPDVVTVKKTLFEKKQVLTLKSNEDS